MHPVFHPDLHQINNQIRINSCSLGHKTCAIFIQMVARH